MDQQQLPQANSVGEAVVNVLLELGSMDNMSRRREYNGQSHTSDGVRGAWPVSGLTLRDLKDCYFRAYVLSHVYYKNDNPVELMQPNAALIDEAEKGENALICLNDLYRLKGDVDPLAIWQNMFCEIEKMAGIYPNIPRQRPQPKELTFLIALEPPASSDQCWGIAVPGLPGCFSSTDVPHSAAQNATEAITLHLEGYLEEGMEIPLQPPHEVLMASMEEGTSWLYATVTVPNPTYQPDSEKAA